MVVRPSQPARAASRSAFTLLEVLIVVAILVVLASVSSIYVFRYLDDAKVKAAKAGVKAIETAALGYQTNYGNLPESLQQLVQPPSGNKPYIEATALIDPWEKQYQYDPSGGNNGGLKPDVWTTSPDGQTIGNWPAATQTQ
jgi:general secretion pathway protein G